MTHFDHLKKWRDSRSGSTISKCNRCFMYLANCKRPDISFAVNLLARFSLSPTHRHWSRIKHIFRYLQETIDLGLFYLKYSKGQNCWFCRCKISFRSTQSLIAHMILFHDWRHCYNLAFSETNTLSDLFKSCWDHRTPWSK